MANNQNEQHEGYLEIPLEDYVVLGETAIHKTFALVWGALSFLTGITLFAVAVYTNWYSLLTTRLVGFILQYWYLTTPFFIISGLFFYLYLKTQMRNRKRNKPEPSKQKTSPTK